MALIDYERKGHIATVTINRPAAHNALTYEMWKELEEVFSDKCTDKRTRVVILRGAGTSSFSSGADIQQFPEYLRGVRSANRYWEVLDRANSAVEECQKPVIAMVRGFALGAACGLAASCDLRIADDKARWGVPAPRIGLTLGINDTRRIVRTVGTHARLVLLSARQFRAEDGLRMGYFDMVVPAAELENVTYDLAEEIATQNAPLTMVEAKQNLQEVFENPGLAGIRERSRPIHWQNSEDLAEGVDAFLNKRRPQFKGR